MDPPPPTPTKQVDNNGGRCVLCATDYDSLQRKPPSPPLPPTKKVITLSKHFTFIVLDSLVQKNNTASSGTGPLSVRDREGCHYCISGSKMGRPNGQNQFYEVFTKSMVEVKVTEFIEFRTLFPYHIKN